MSVIDFKPKGRKKKISIESAVEQVVASKPKTVLVIGETEDGKDILVFHSGTTQEHALWLLEQMKFLIMNGEMEED